MRRVAAAALALLVAAPAQAGAVQDLLRARGEFQRGEFSKVIELLYPQLYPTALLRREAELIEAHYLLGVSYFYLDQRERARQEFVALLYVSPDYDLDPVVESPEVYAFFQELKGELRTQLDEIRRQKELAAKAAAVAPSREVLIERTLHPRAAYINWIPFGAGQFRNGQPEWGAAFLAGELILGGTSVALFSYQWIKFGIPLVLDTPAERSLARDLQIWQLATGVGFVAVYALGVYHAYRFQAPEVTERRSERALPAPASTPTSFDSRREIRDFGSAILYPLLAPGAVGVGLGGTF